MRIGGALYRAARTTARAIVDETRLHSIALLRSRFRRRHARPCGRGGLFGVNLVGYIRAEMGLGTAARGLADALEAAQIPFTILNVERGNRSRHSDLSWAHREASDAPYAFTLVCVNPDNSRNLRLSVPTAALGSRYVIGHWYWEMPEWPDRWLPEIGLVDEIWSASAFMYDAVSAKASVPVVRVPTAVCPPSGVPYRRDYFALPEDKFLFLSMFDADSVLERKNPWGSLQAFRLAFPNQPREAALVMKVNNAGHDRGFIDELRARIGIGDDVFVLDRALSRDAVWALLSCCDCFLSLHRAEGFGLCPAEAMCLGKPAILTAWSGNVDYMRRDNSVGIDYTLVPLGRDHGPYRATQHWADPDLHQAAWWMRRLVREPGLAAAIGARGRETIQTSFSPRAVGALIRQRLMVIAEC